MATTPTPKRPDSQTAGTPHTIESTLPSAEPEERIPAFQHVLDNPFLLLFIGVAVPTVVYILWGVMEIATVPISPLAK